jgi:hypothetical protein
MLSVILLCVVLFLVMTDMWRVVMLNVIILSVVMLHCYSECCCVECCYDECLYAGCLGLNKCFSLYVWEAMRMRHYISFRCLTGSYSIILLYFLHHWDKLIMLYVSFTDHWNDNYLLSSCCSVKVACSCSLEEDHDDWYTL